ncbi:AarF/UbiB family protein [Puniceicoccaceae bacterium K14]|nr:AarF/UbiB family protein [Puniceicoccaceae bacterium K14]
MGPTFIKFGQLLSMRPDVVPQALMDELRFLQETVPPADFEDVKPMLEHELGGSLEDFFVDFVDEAKAGASMAQVHYARLKGSGKPVAIKVQRPGLRKKIEADFDILFWFAKQAHERLEELRGYDLPGLVETLREGLERELDFSQELRSMQFFTIQNPYPEDVCIPQVYETLCTSRVIVMDWIEGAHLAEFESGSNAAKRIAQIGSKSLFNQIMLEGFFHADPHAGNIRVLDDSRICFLDWGLVGHMTRRMRYGLSDLFLAFVRGSAEDVVATAIALAESSEPLNRREMEREVMIAIRTHYNVETGVGNMGKAILALFYVFGRNGIDLAREYSLVAKAILCIEEAGNSLDPKYNISDQFEPILRTLIRDQKSPKRILLEAKSGMSRSLSYLQQLPDELHRLLNKVDQDRLKVNFQHRGLDKLDHTIGDASNKITLGIIIGCLIVGSSLIITTNNPPLLFGYPLIGLLGFVLSMVLGAWVAFDILRGGRR